VKKRIKKSLDSYVDYINHHISPELDICVESIGVIRRDNKVKSYVIHFNCERCLGEKGFHIVDMFSPDTTPGRVIKYIRKEIPVLVGWGITREKYIKEYGRNLISLIDHKDAVERAVRFGKPVPPKVIMDYPELVAH
jgi:hypothetical protein